MMGVSQKANKTFTAKEVAEHHTARSTWVIYENRVFDVTEFLFDHPGGEEFILQYAGKDITQVMVDELEHLHSESAFEILEQYCIGSLDVLSTKKAVQESKTVDTATFIDINKPMLKQVWNSNFSKEFYLKQVHIPRHAKDSAPIFGPPYLEVFTKTPWWVIPLVWLPFSANLFFSSLNEIPLIPALFFMATGMFAWTFLEYSFHRFLFHIEALLPDHPAALTFHFLIHGVHHFLPMDRMRLVMPPALFSFLSFPVYHFVFKSLPNGIDNSFASGTFLGYVLYDLMHYYLHHGKPYGDYLKEMKTYHLDHHYKEANLGFGITFKFWDKIFGTLLD